jgi:hypothetical protein
LVAVCWRTNLTLRQIGPLFGEKSIDLDPLPMT